MSHLSACTRHHQRGALSLLTVLLMGVTAAHALELNQATEAQLDGLRGLGPSSTARILQARESGAFQNWSDFMARVKGIKPTTASKLSSQGMTVNGAAFTAPEK